MVRSKPSLRVRIVVPLLLLALVAPLGAEAPSGDPKAAALAESVLEHMGGQAAWDATRFVRFNFFGFRTHHWDRYTGRHRLEGANREGQTYVVLHDINSREGRAWLDGEELDGEKKAESLEMAYSAWINDTYWLFMPYKLRDPGVTLTLDGEETVDGVVHDKLKLTFDSVGLTPGDTYWAFVSRESGLMNYWAFHLQGWEAEREPSRWSWEEWQDYGGILLASKRHNAAADRTAMLGDIAVFDHLDDAVFTDPAAP